MYSHARQFPHLAGLPDSEIRAIAQRAMSRNPNLIRVMRIRNFLVLIGMFVAVTSSAAYSMFTPSGESLVGLGWSLLIVGGLFSALILLWNVIWINIVIFRITREEVEPGKGSEI